MRIQWRWSKVVVFVLLTFAISSNFYIIMYLTGSVRDIGALWMWSPAMGAILTLWLFGGRIRDLGWGWGQRKYLLWGLIIPFLYAGIIYGIAWATGVAGFRPPSLMYILFLPIGFLAACLAALGEEIGWRGFFVPELSRLTTFSKTALISWLVWSVWHYPPHLICGLSQPVTPLVRHIDLDDYSFRIEHFYDMAATQIRQSLASRSVARFS